MKQTQPHGLHIFYVVLPENSCFYANFKRTTKCLNSLKHLNDAKSTPPPIKNNEKTTKTIFSKWNLPMFLECFMVNSPAPKLCNNDRNSHCKKKIICNCPV